MVKRVFLVALVVFLLGWDVITAVGIGSVKQDKKEVDEARDLAEQEVYEVLKDIEDFTMELLSIEKRRELIEDKEEEKTVEIEEANIQLAKLRIGIYEESVGKELRELDQRERLTSLQSRNVVGDLLSIFLNSGGLGSLISSVRSYEMVVEKDMGIISGHVDSINKMEKERERVEDLLTGIDKMMGDLEGYRQDLGELEKQNLKTTHSLERKNRELDKKLSSLVLRSEALSKEIKRLEEIERKKIIEREAREREARERAERERLSKLDVVEGSVVKKERFEGDFSVEEVSVDIDELIKVVAKEYDLPESLLKGVIRVESNFNIDAVNVNRNGTTDRGIMQLNSGTAPWLAKRIGLDYEVGVEFIPEYGIRMGALYLKDQWKENQDLEYVLTAYNRGPGGASKWFKDRGTYRTDYSEKALSYMREYGYE